MHGGWIDSHDGEPPSRLTEVKEFFKNTAVRVSGMGLNTYLGLFTFSHRHEIEVERELTPVHLNFEDQIEDVEPLSETAMLDAIERAREMLVKTKKSHSGVKCRILILTDGMDNESVINPWEVARKLATDKIVLDSIVIGTEWTSDLFKISKITDGYAFAPDTQQAFF